LIDIKEAGSPLPPCRSRKKFPFFD